jgi:hypothetical protein
MSEGVRIGLVRGRTPVVSWGIQLETRSVYSHANIVFDDGTVYEAEAQGFLPFASLSVNNAGCEVDLFAWDPPLSSDEVAKARAICEGLKGEHYDYAGVAGFITRANYEPPEDVHKLFCSEAVVVLSIALGPERALLVRVPAFKVPPGWLIMSPRLRFVETVVVPK